MRTPTPASIVALGALALSAPLAAAQELPWSVVREPAPGAARFVHGGALAPDRTPASAADVGALARRALAATRALHGVEPATLGGERVLALPMAHVGTTDKLCVRFDQAFDGVPVEGGFVNVLLDAEGTALAVQSTAVPRLAALETRPGLAAARAVRLAEAEFERATGLAANRLEPPALVVLPVAEEARRAALAWRVGLQWLRADSRPEGLDVWIDAADGRVLARRANVHFLDVTGTVSTLATPGSRPDLPDNPPVPFPAAHLALASDQGSAVTDATGAFTFPGAGSVTNVVARYEGPFARVVDVPGADWSLAAGTLSGGGNALAMNPAGTALVTAQANAFVGTTFFRDWVRALNPGDATMDFQVLANVNHPLSCSAYYNGVSTNYFQAGGGCTNTSFSSVVAHETGHWANALYGTGNGSDGMGEGNADVFSMYQYDTPLIGEDFCGPGCIRRTGENTRPYCGDGNGGCYGEVHDDGEVWMGAAWKVRRNLKASLGAALGGLTADTLFMGWMNAFDQQTIHSVIETQWLVLDDDDGDLANGTPSFAAIDAAFREQGFPGVDLPALAITGVSGPDHGPAPGPWPVSATITALAAPPVTAASLFWSADGGAFSEVPLAPAGGGLWSGSIPAVATPATLRWYLGATDSGAGSGTWPAPGAWRTVLAGELATVLADDLESDTGWSVAGSAATGAWERADPEGTAAQPEDDASPTGTRCFVTGAAAGGSVGANDLDGGPTELVSPVFALGADAALELAYWMYNDDGDDALVLELSSDGGASWSPVTAFVGGAGGWASTSFVVSDVLAPTATMRLRVSVADQPNNSITEAAIDEVRVVELAAPACPAPVVTCTPTSNSTGGPATIGWRGTPSVAANDLVLATAGAPPGNSALYVYSPDEVATPLGNGILCVGSATLGFVLRLPPLTTDAAGTAQQAFDNTAPPHPLGQVSAGETWLFQFWFRDPAAGGAGFDFSDALRVTFCP